MIDVYFKFFNKYSFTFYFSINNGLALPFFYIAHDSNLEFVDVY